LAKDCEAEEGNSIDKEVKPKSHEGCVMEQPFVEDKCARCANEDVQDKVVQKPRCPEGPFR
jgi:hypothetical protein